MNWKRTFLAAVALSAAVSKVSFGNVLDGLLVNLPFDVNATDVSGNPIAPDASPNHDDFQVVVNPAIADPKYIVYGPGFLGAKSFGMTEYGYATSAGSAATNGASVMFGTDRSFSSSFWTKINGPNGVGHTDDPAFISNKAWTSGSNVGWVVSTDTDGRLQWNYREPAPISRSDYDGPPGTMDDSKWHHVVTTFQRNIDRGDGTFFGSAATYIDGVLVNRSNFNSDHGDLDGAGLPTNIGQDGTGQYPDGHWLPIVVTNPDTGEITSVTPSAYIDDVGIWDRVLSGSEISQIYTEGLKGNALISIVVPPPANHWAPAASGDWNVANNWSDAIIPNGVDAIGNLTSSISSHQTVYTDTDITLGTLNFDNANTYVLTGSGTLTMKTSFGSAAINVIKGTHKINLPLTLANNTDINVAVGGDLIIADPLKLAAGITVNKNGLGILDLISTQSATGPATLKVNAGMLNLQQNGGSNLSIVVAGGSVNFNAAQSIKSLSLSAGSAVQMLAGANKVIKTNGLTFAGATNAWQGKLDLNDNDMVVQADAATRLSVLDAVTNQIGSARNAASGKWTGNGITSTSAKGVASGITGLAVALNDNGQGVPLYTNFDGVAVDKNSVLVKYTYNGDMDLNGKIDADDYFRIDNGFVRGLTGYGNGDLDFNGKVDADDYFLIDNAFVSQSGILAVDPSAASAVPEPTSLGLIGVAAVGLLRRRRR